MGAGQIARDSTQLVAHGLPGSMPVLAVSRRDTKGERRLLSRLDTIADDLSSARLPSPVLIIVGRVVSLYRACPQAILARIAADLPAEANPCLTGPALDGLLPSARPSPCPRKQGSPEQRAAELERLVLQDCGLLPRHDAKGRLGPDIRAVTLAGTSADALAAIILDGVPDQGDATMAPAPDHRGCTLDCGVSADGGPGMKPLLALVASLAFSATCAKSDDIRATGDMGVVIERATVHC